MAATMIPASEVLARPVGSEVILPNGRPTPAFRDELRHIPTVRNVATLVWFFTQIIGILAAAVWLHHPAVYVLAFLLMGRANAVGLALMHEAAHRLLLRNKRTNDWVGRWLLGYPFFTPTDLYRRAHAAHHREEFGPGEPDLDLYRGYPIPTASMRRKLWRDATGQTGWKLMRSMLRGTRSERAEVRRNARRIVAVQALLFALGAALGHPWLWPLLWLAPHLTVWRVINRLRSIAEHGGMGASPDRRATTHTVRQTWPARFALVPCCIGFHLAHHVDAGVPMKHLPRFHRELVRAGYITPEIEYPSYRALWRRLAGG